MVWYGWVMVVVMGSDDTVVKMFLLGGCGVLYFGSVKFRH